MAQDDSVNATIGRFVLGLMITGVGAWVGALASFIEFREPMPGAVCLIAGSLAFGAGLLAVLRSLQ